MMDDLPNSPGVYIFHGQEGDFPVYIGKSINLRSRVLSHLAYWPYPGSVGLVERHQSNYQMHVINHWCYLGSVDNPDKAMTEARAVASQAAGLDADGYKILYRPLLSGNAEIVPLWRFRHVRAGEWR